MTLPAEPLNLPAIRSAGGLQPELADYMHAKPGFGSGDDEAGVDLKKLFFAFRRRLKLFLAIAALVFAGFVLGPLRAPPTYTATARVEIDPRKKEVVNIQQVESDLPVNEVNIVDTEVEVLKSRQLAERVVSELHLDQDPEFNPAPGKKGLVGTILHGVARLRSKPEPAGGAPQSELEAQEAHERVVDAALGRLTVRRSGLTYVIDVSVTSPHRDKAALVANTFSDRYLSSQMESKTQANRDANGFLSERAAQMEPNLKTAEDALAQYKISHNLLSAGNETLTQEEISNLNMQMAQAKAAQAEAEAQVRTARAQLAAGSNGSDVTGALASPVVTSLRAQRATISTHVAELSQKYGPLHPDLLKAKQQLVEIDSEIQQAVNRTISGLEAQTRIAKERTDSLQATLNKTRGALESNNRTSVELNALQRNADAERALYEAFLTRAKQTAADQGLEGADARILSRATIPTHPSAPNTSILLLLALVSGAGLGVAGVFIAEVLDSGLITGDDVEKRLDIAFLGAIPHLASVEKRWRKRSASPTTHVVEQPASAFGEAFCSLRTSIRHARLSKGGQIIAFASALPGEGKTTAAICLGRIAARAGERVLVVDCDLRRNSVSKTLKLQPAKGLLEVLNGEAKLGEALVRDAASGAYVLPLATAGAPPNLVFGTPAADRLLADLRQEFDLIILDTPPVLATSEARDIVAKADGVIFLARWRRTPQKAVESALQMVARVDGRLIGLALAQVDMREQSRYGYGDAGYYYGRYRSYYAS